MHIVVPREPRILGVYGQRALAHGSIYLHHGIKATQIYQDRPSDDTFKMVRRDRDVRLVAPHYSRIRFEVLLGKKPPIFLVPHDEEGPRWHGMRRAALRGVTGQTAVGRHIFFPPLSDNDPSLNPPADTQKLAFLELLSGPDSVNQRLPLSEMREGGTMVVLGIGEKAIEQISLAYGSDNDPNIFDPTPLNNRTLPPQERSVGDPYLVASMARYLIVMAQNTQ